MRPKEKKERRNGDPCLKFEQTVRFCYPMAAVHGRKERFRNPEKRR